MKQFDVLTVDDEGPALRRLNKMVKLNPQLKLRASAASAKEAIQLISSMHFDLILLDIQLKDATAFEVLEKVKLNFRGKIIFTTAFNHYAVKAFEVGATDYLLKPFTEEKFNQSINHWITLNDQSDLTSLLHLLQTENSKRLTIKEGSRQHFFNQDDILWIKAETYYSRIVQQNETNLLRISLKQLEENLPKVFIRINRSYIVNTTNIKSLTTYKRDLKVTMSDSNEIIVSNKYKKAFENQVK